MNACLQGSADSKCQAIIISEDGRHTVVEILQGINDRTGPLAWWTHVRQLTYGNILQYLIKKKHQNLMCIHIDKQ